MTISILGRQPKLGLAELESVFGSKNIRPVGSTAVIVDGTIELKRFGGQLKTGIVLDTLDTTDFNKLIDHTRRNLPKLLKSVPEGKIKLGLSFYDLDVQVSKINSSALSLKKIVKSAGRSVRIAPNTEPALSTAQTVHNQLASPVGIEFIFVRDGNKTILAKLNEVQNLNDYTARDRGRPKRDAFVGMLPPKLAQIMINLAGKHVISEGAVLTEPLENAPRARLLDPFCGTGVILQEATLRGYAVYGTDISERMVRYSRDNLNWLFDRYGIRTDVYYETADATTHTWQQPIDLVACEGYLGQPMSQEPPREKLEEIIHECNGIMRNFLKNIAPQLKSGTRLCIGSPAWFVNDGTRHLPALDDLEDLGYNRIDFEHANREDLIYHREDQIVGRELVVLTKE
jgi:tRNA G10  N-methylase Trm11